MKVLRRPICNWWPVVAFIRTQRLGTVGRESRLQPRRLYAAAALCITLTACGTTQSVTPQIVTKTVEVPVVVHCKPDIGPEPDYPDTDTKLKAAPDMFVKLQLILAGRLERIAHEQVLKAALTACEG